MTYTHRIKNGVRVDLTADEITSLENRDNQWNNDAFDRAISDLRDKRNRLLAETDYYALSDVTMSDDMKTYRQNLRDITEGKDTVEKCENVTWPTKP